MKVPLSWVPTSKRSMAWGQHPSCRPAYGQASAFVGRQQHRGIKQKCAAIIGDEQAAVVEVLSAVLVGVQIGKFAAGIPMRAHCHWPPIFRSPRG